MSTTNITQSNSPMNFIVPSADIREIAKRENYMIESHDYDTTNILCVRGHIYADGKYWVAAMDAATRAESRELRKLGEVIMDGDGGELSVKFAPARFREVANILKPRQARKRVLAA